VPATERATETMAQPQEDNPLPVVAEDYPESFRPLIVGVLRESGGYANVWVGFEAVRKHIGNNAAVNKLGWETYTQFVKRACDANYIQAHPHSRRIRLIVPNNKSANEVCSGQNNACSSMF
jgi:hypothetical protein